MADTVKPSPVKPNPLIELLITLVIPSLILMKLSGPAGTPAFNEELGRLTLLSYPMIALPSMLILMAVLFYLTRTIRELAELKLAEALKH